MKKIVILLFTICLSLDASAQASGGQIKRKSVVQKVNKKDVKRNRYNDSTDELERNYDKMSVGELRKYAEEEEEDPMAQYRLGVLYYERENYKVAIEWFRKAASNDSENAKIYLASCYYYGLGVSRDNYMAKVWLESAARKGNRQAKEYLISWFK